MKETESLFYRFTGGHFHPEDIPGIGFSLEQDGRIPHDQGNSVTVQLGLSVVGQERYAGFVDQGQEPVIAEMSAVIQVGCTDRYFGLEGICRKWF